MDVNVRCAWKRGVRSYRGTRISDGIYDMVTKILTFISFQPGQVNTAVINCWDLLIRMQVCCDHGKINLNFVPATAQPSQPQPQPQPQPQSSCSSVIVGPFSPGPSRKRPSTTKLDGGPSEKRTREAASPPVVPPPSSIPYQSSPFYSDVEPASVSDFPLSLSPIAVRRPVSKRKPVTKRKLSIPLQCSLRAEIDIRRTARYESPMHSDWGVSGTAANAIDACMPSPAPRPMNRAVTSCTRCHCELDRATANDDAARPAVCVLCGAYKAKRVSTQFLFIKLALRSYSFCVFSLEVVICN